MKTCQHCGTRVGARNNSGSCGSCSGARRPDVIEFSPEQIREASAELLRRQLAFRQHNLPAPAFHAVCANLGIAA